MRKNLVVSLSYLIVAAWGCLPTLSNRMGVAIASSSNSVAVAKTDREPPQQKLPTGKQIERTPIQQSKRLKIEIDVTSPGDLLVKEGQAVTANQLIADRKSERMALSAQLQATNLSIERLQAAPQVLQLPPAGVKTLNSHLAPEYRYSHLAPEYRY